LEITSLPIAAKNPWKDSMVRSLPHGVPKVDEKPPQGNELKAPFGELVVAGRRQMAARADCGRTLARSHGDFDALLVGTEVGVLVDKTPETMAAV
jgi:hypothetical protein